MSPGELKRLKNLERENAQLKKLVTELSLDKQILQDVLPKSETYHKILTAEGMGAFQGKAFRIGNMGQQAVREQIEVLIDAISTLAGKAAS